MFERIPKELKEEDLFCLYKMEQRKSNSNLENIAVYCGNRFLIIRPKFEDFILNSSEI